VRAAAARTVNYRSEGVIVRSTIAALASIGVLASALSLACVGPLPTPHKSDDVPVTIAVWGDPADGVQLGLAVSPDDWAYPGKLPTLEMRLRNTGDREVIFVPGVISRAAQIEIDGVWSPPGFYAAAASEHWVRLAAGAETGNIPFEVVAFDAAGGRHTLLDTLDIKAGKHALRVKIFDGVHRSLGAPNELLDDRMTLVSNPITVAVAPVR
jgi:hypothetical protein